MENALTPVERLSTQDYQQRYRELMQLYDGAIREVRTKLEVLDAEFSVRYALKPLRTCIKIWQRRERLATHIKFPE